MKKLWRLNRWHRWIGFVASLFVLMLAVTGLLLNHTETLKLDRNYIASEPILDWYGIQPQQPPVSYSAGDHWVTRVDGQLYYDNKLLATDVEKLVGAVRMEEFVVVAADHELYLLTDNGEVIEELGGVEGVPAGMRAIGLEQEGGLIIRAAHDIYTTNLDTLGWQHTEPSRVDWSEPVQAPIEHMNRVLKQYRGSGLSFERVLLDLHSGRIIGGIGVWVVDIAAILFCGLAITGMIMWFRGY